MSTVCDACQEPAGSCLDTCPRRVQPASPALIDTVPSRTLALIAAGAVTATVVLTLATLAGDVTGAATVPGRPSPAHTVAVPTPAVPTAETSR